MEASRNERWLMGDTYDGHHYCIATGVKRWLTERGRGITLVPYRSNADSGRLSESAMAGWLLRTCATAVQDECAREFQKLWFF